MDNFAYKVTSEPTYTIVSETESDNCRTNTPLPSWAKQHINNDVNQEAISQNASKYLS